MDKLSLVVIKGNKSSIFRIFKESDYFPWPNVGLASFILSYVVIVKTIMNFLEDQDVGILYLSTKFELNQFTNNGDLLSDRKKN